MNVYAWIAVGSVALLLLVIAWKFFGRRILDWRRRASLSIDVSMGPPYCIKGMQEMYDNVSGQFVGEADSYCVRLAVSNVGRSPAVNVEVYVKSIAREVQGGGFQRLGGVGAPVLCWVDVWSGSNTRCPVLAVHSSLLCKLGHTVDPAGKYWHFGESPESLGVDRSATVFSLDSARSSAGRSGSPDYLLPPELNLPPGRYLLDIAAIAENSKEAYGRIEVGLSGKWYPDERMMWGRGLFVR